MVGVSSVMIRQFFVSLITFFPFVYSITTCPGFPGYCSESFPGTECNVVCDVGRNNVPLCQADGTWTDIPRCVEHEPGVDEQVPGLCPSIPGYCAQGYLNTRCLFDCRTGPDIDSLCTQDGTWAPYPTCEGDLRETQDGCDGCPGPKGGLRNRTAEAALLSNTISDRRVPKIIEDNGGRKTIPSFAGNINVGLLNPETKVEQRFVQGRPAPKIASTSGSTTSFTTQKSIATTTASQGSLFDRIKGRIQRAKEKQQRNGLLSTTSTTFKPIVKPTPKYRTPVQPPPQAFGQSPSSATFGVYEQVNLSPFGAQTSNQVPRTSNQVPRVPKREDGSGFFGVFPEVKLKTF